MFVPFAQLLAERDDHTEGTLAEAERVRVQAAELKGEVDTAMAAARAEALAEAEKIRRQARADETGIFERAKSDAAARLAELRSGIQQERKSAASALAGEATELARQMTAAVFGPAQRN